MTVVPERRPTSFTVVVERDPESGWLVGEVVELPGCYTQAPDLAAMEQSIREAIVAYLKTTDLSEPPSGLRRHVASRGQHVTRLRLVPYRDLAKVAEAAGFLKVRQKAATSRSATMKAPSSLSLITVLR